MQDQAPSPGYGDMIGRYRLIEVIGEGGMGDVWLADQSEPIERRVALKLIKIGMDTREVVARFESERQALAVMDHPNIAKVFDGGATENGRPYFVMELVDGEPITAFCDERRFSIRQRVELFISVCQAVQHAHLKGIIHRDLKPSNILVADVDGVPVCKVIDFGVARAVESEAGDRTQLTRAGYAVGTPAYMSPEQVLEDAGGIDTRSDIFALGVILYELLSGALPRDEAAYRGAAMLGSAVTDPAKPSSRFDTLSDTRETISRARACDPPTLKRQLRQDLDWIVMKAMALEPDRRYPTANGMAIDLERYLRQEPVLARPPNTSYRVGKFVRRNRGLVAASVAGLIALIVGLIGTTQGFLQASRERDRTAAVNDYLVKEILGAPDPAIEGTDVRVVDVLDRASAGVETAFAGQPVLEADIRFTLAVTYRGLGLYERSEQHAAAAYRIRSELYGPDDLATLLALDRVGRARFHNDDNDEAIDALTVAATGIERELGPEANETLEVRAALAAAYERRGDFQIAADMQRELVATRQRVFGELEYETLQEMLNLASTLSLMGENQEAEALFTRVIEGVDEIGRGEDHAAILAMVGLSHVYNAIGDYDRAEDVARRAWESGKRLYGEDHPEAIGMLSSLGNVIRFDQRYDEAEPILRQVAEQYRARLGDEHQYTLAAVHNLAGTLARMGRLEEAERMHLQNLAARRRAMGERSVAVAGSLGGLGIVYTNSERWDEAIDAYAEALDILRGEFGDGHPDVATNLSNLSRAYQQSGDYEGAAGVLRELVVLDTAAVGPAHRWVMTDYKDLIWALARFAPEQAETVARERLAITTRELGAEDPYHFESQALLGMTLGEQHRFEEAEPLLIDGFDGLMAAVGVEDGRTDGSLDYLIRLYELMERPDDVERYRAIRDGN